jgi:tetratricopeptide (TPR) repeat protein
MYTIGVFFILTALATSSLYENENTDIELLYKKSLESYADSKFDEVLFYLDSILKQDPSNSFVLYNKGVVLVHLEKYDESLQYFEKAIEINPNFIEAINGKDLALTNLNQNAEGISMFYDQTMMDQYKMNLHMIDPDNLANLKHMNVPPSTYMRQMGYAKIEVRNSDDQLVGYTESHDFFFQYPSAWMILEDQSEWKPIDVKGKKLKVLEYSVNIPASQSYLSSQTDIVLLKEGQYGFHAIKINHDGLFISPGDRLHVKVVLFRPG